MAKAKRITFLDIDDIEYIELSSEIENKVNEITSTIESLERLAYGERGLDLKLYNQMARGLLGKIDITKEYLNALKNSVYNDYLENQKSDGAE